MNGFAGNNSSGRQGRDFISFLLSYRFSIRSSPRVENFILHCCKIFTIKRSFTFIITSNFYLIEIVVSDCSSHSITTICEWVQFRACKWKKFYHRITLKLLKVKKYCCFILFHLKWITGKVGCITFFIITSFTCN